MSAVLLPEKSKDRGAVEHRAAQIIGPKKALSYGSYYGPDY